MIKKAVIVTRTTSTYVRENLNNFDTYISTVNSDIENFNQYVKLNMDELKARGDCTDEFMTKLFEACQVASDGECVRYIKKQRDQYDNGYNISIYKLMTSALKQRKQVELYATQTRSDSCTCLYC